MSHGTSGTHQDTVLKTQTATTPRRGKRRPAARGDGPGDEARVTRREVGASLGLCRLQHSLLTARERRKDRNGTGGTWHGKCKSVRASVPFLAPRC